MRHIAGDDGDPYDGPAVELLVAYLGRGDGEPALKLGDNRAYHRALLLQRPYVTEEDVQREAPDVHLARYLPGRRRRH
jgi:hypothetical protein